MTEVSIAHLRTAIDMLNQANVESPHFAAFHEDTLKMLYDQGCLTYYTRINDSGSFGYIETEYGDRIELLYVGQDIPNRTLIDGKLV